MKRRYFVERLLITLSLTIVISPSVQSDLANPIKLVAATPISRDAVLSKVAEIMGVRLLEHAVADSSSWVVKQTTIVDSCTPFLSHLLNGKDAWQVNLGQISMRVAVDSSGNTIERKRDVRAQLREDSVGHVFVQIISRDSVFDPKKIKYTPLQLAESQLSGHFERYFGLPATFPKISFAEALQRLHGYPLLAKEIVGQYLLWGRDEDSTSARPAWVVSVYGFPVKDVFPSATGSCWRWVVDAETGIVQFGSNVPTPEW